MLETFCPSKIVWWAVRSSFLGQFWWWSYVRGIKSLKQNEYFVSITSLILQCCNSGGRKEELNVNGLAQGDLETTWCNFCESRCWDTGTPEPGLTFGVGVKEHPWQRRGSWCCIIGQSGGETDILCPIRGQSRWQLSNAGCQGRETEVGHWSQTCGSSMQSRQPIRGLL